MKTESSDRGKPALGRLPFLGSCLLAGVLAAPSAGAQALPTPAYTVTNLGTLSGGATIPNAINASRQVVGSSSSPANTARAFLWKNGVLSDLLTLGGADSAAFDVNSLGEVVGNSTTAAGTYRAFLWEAGTPMIPLGTLGGSGSQANGINDSRQVVGSSDTSPTYPYEPRAFLWEDGTMRSLGTLEPLQRGTSSASDINNSGQVVGSATTAFGSASVTSGNHAFLWQGNAMTDLLTLGGRESYATALNDSGQVVGYSNTAVRGQYRAFSWKAGVMTDLETLGGNSSFANDINDSGQVVGNAELAGGSVHAFLWKNGVMQDLNDLIDRDSGWVLTSAEAINDAGEIVGYGQINFGPIRAFLLSPFVRRPVLLIPGIGATYPANTGDIGPWMFTRGIHPDELQLDPLAHAYDDVIQTLKNVGYVEGKDLFVVNYDWRIPVGPSDGVFDGYLNGITATSISDESFQYGVDYLGHTLLEAAQRWESDHEGRALDAVDVISHSTGGLVARAYVQSEAYGGEYVSGKNLPRIGELIMIGVPNRGASKPWNTMHDNWGVDIAFQVVLSKIVNMGYQKVLAGAIITGPDHDISLSSISAPACLDGRELCFIRQYNPTARALLATYDFIDFGNGLTNVNNDPAFRNDLVLDLNAGFDLAPNGDPNSFADEAKVTVIYATSEVTPTTVVEKLGPEGGTNAIVHFTDFVPRDAQPGQLWYDDIEAVTLLSGDGTVPVVSSAGQFVGDSRVTLLPFEKDSSLFAPDVSHLGLMYNIDVQKEVLGILGASFVEEDISTGRHEAIASLMSAALNIVPNIIGGSILGAIFDPVEGFVVDAQGRRLGFSAATGPVTEIPGSVWLGNADGLGWALEPVQEPLTLKLTGLGGNYYTLVSVLSSTGLGGVADQGFLAVGEQRDLSLGPADDVVDALSFPACADVDSGSVVTTAPRTISGINVPVSINVSGDASAQYSRNGGPFTSAAGTVVEGDVIRLRLIAAFAGGTTVTNHLELGTSFSTDWTVTTLIDDTPLIRSFVNRTDVASGVTIVTEPHAVKGINVPASVAVSGDASAQYSIDQGPFTSAPGTVRNGSSIRLKLVSPAAGTTATSHLVIGSGYSADWTVTSRGRRQPTVTPDLDAFVNDSTSGATR